MSDEIAVQTEPVQKRKGRPKGSKNTAKRLLDLQEENERLKQELATKDAVAEHFEKIEGFKDEHDRAIEEHKEKIADAKERGVSPDEVIENDLDSSRVVPKGQDGREFLKNYQLRWVNRVSRDGARTAYHEGLGYFFVLASKHPVKPTHGIKREDNWWWGETILMAVSMDRYIARRRKSLEKMLHQGGKDREAAREEMNRLIREDTGQPHAQPGITKSYRDNTWDRVEEGPPITGPSAHSITPA